MNVKGLFSLKFLSTSCVSSESDISKGLATQQPLKLANTTVKEHNDTRTQELGLGSTNQNLELNNSSLFTHFLSQKGGYSK